MNKILDLDLICINKKAVNMVSKKICEDYSVFPYEIEKNKIFLVSYEFLNKERIIQLEFLLKLSVDIKLCTKEQLWKYLSVYYEEDFRSEVTKKIDKTNKGTTSMVSRSVNSPASRVLESLLEEGVSRNASDIHLEPNSSNVIIRFRIDGSLKVITKLEKSIYETLVSRIKILGNMDIAIKYMPQDGEIYMNFHEEEYHFRVSTLPTIYGEKIVLRILKKSKELLRLKNLGFLENDYYTLKNAINLKQGLIIVTGATGSGKTTTLYSFINEISSESKNIITLEKPVECQLNGINQVSIDGLGKNSYEDIIKTVLRQDPDVIMIGEILDRNTAEVAINAALTGHLVLTTLHTNDAISTLIRLKNMGIDMELIRDSLTLIVSQRLTRCICPDCKESYELSAKEMDILNVKNKTIGYKGKGCGKCNGTGYKGRTVAYEILVVYKWLKEIIGICDEGILRERCKDANIETIEDNFKRLVKEGITTVDEYFINMQNYNIEKIVGRDYGI
ncbi:MAG: GspE/PulE family protein [Clostridium sp.]|nr:GspE/PulE family protein [Clostridium sp.]